MTPRTRQILLILLIFGVAALFATLFLYFALRSPAINPIIPDEQVLPGGALTPGGLGGERPVSEGLGGTGTSTGLVPSSIADGGPVLTAQLTSSRVVSPVVSSGSTVQFYDPRDGKFYTISASGEVALLSDVVFPSAETVLFSDNGKVVALEFPDGSNIVYDFEAKKQSTIPAHFEEFSFSKTGDELISKSIGTGNALVTVNSDGTQAKAIADMGNNQDKVTLNWSPADDIVAFSETGAAQSVFGRQEIYLIDKSGNATDTLIVDGGNFSAKWSPSGSGILYSVADFARNQRPSLWFSTTDSSNIGSGRTNLAVETFVEKCTFKDDVTVICAVPRELPDYSGFEPGIVTSPDDVYQINVTTGRVTLLGSPISGLRMTNLRLSDDQSILYFTDQVGRLNSLRLR